MEVPGYPPQSGAMNLTKTLPLFLFVASASCSAQTLVIGLYDYADLSAKETTRLAETAGLALADAGIQVVWAHCRERWPRRRRPPAKQRCRPTRS
jgi:hypothetical protein